MPFFSVDLSCNEETFEAASISLDPLDHLNTINPDMVDPQLQLPVYHMLLPSWRRMAVTD
jgi:hypothetical protein